MRFEHEIDEKVIKAVDEKADEIIEFLRDLVAVPSISGTPEEGKAQEVVARKFKEIKNLETDIWEPNIDELGKYPLSPLRSGPWNYKDRPNIVGTLKGPIAGRSLILNGHIDVVSPEPIDAWKHDPWAAEIAGGKLFGRGSMDMKAGIAAMTYAVMVVQELELTLKGKVILESVVEEELGSGGTIATLLKGYCADAAIVTEPTDADAICIGLGGVRYCRIKISGKTEWPHLAHYGVNAIGLAMKVYSALIELDNRRVKRLKGKHPLFETSRAGGMRGPGRSTNMTIGILKAGDFPATVAGMAELTVRIGFPPSERAEDVMREIEETVKHAAEQDSWMREHLPIVEWFGSRKDGYELSSESPIIQALKRNVERVSGNSEIFAFASAGDSNHLAVRAGSYGGIPAIWYGPGGAQAHSSDEYVKLEDIVNVTKVLALTILDWCGYEGQ